MTDQKRKLTEPRRQPLWSLQKDGREIACLVTRLEQGGCELTITRSDRDGRSVLRYSTHESAMTEAQRLATSFLAHGWAFASDAHDD